MTKLLNIGSRGRQSLCRPKNPENLASSYDSERLIINLCCKCHCLHEFIHLCTCVYLIIDDLGKNVIFIIYLLHTILCAYKNKYFGNCTILSLNNNEEK